MQLPNCPSSTSEKLVQACRDTSDQRGCFASTLRGESTKLELPHFSKYLERYFCGRISERIRTRKGPVCLRCVDFPWSYWEAVVQGWAMVRHENSPKRLFCLFFCLCISNSHFYYVNTKITNVLSRIIMPKMLAKITF